MDSVIKGRVSFIHVRVSSDAPAAGTLRTSPPFRLYVREQEACGVIPFLSSHFDLRHYFNIYTQYQVINVTENF